MRLGAITTRMLGECDAECHPCVGGDGRWLGRADGPVVDRRPPHCGDQRLTVAATRVTCGVLVLDRGRLLIGQATGSPRWDIPKGIAEPDETWPEAAVRELREETGLVVEADGLSPLGVHPYLPGKRLALFVWQPASMPDPATLRCTSTFRARDGRLLPELARFAVLPWADALTRLGKNMARVLGDPAVVSGVAALPGGSAAG